MCGFGLLAECVFPRQPLVEAQQKIRHQHADHFQLAERPLANQPRGLDVVGGVMPGTTHKKLHVAAFRKVPKLLGLCGRECHGFLNEHVQPGLEGCLGLREVHVGSRSNDHGVEVAGSQHFLDGGAGPRGTKVARDFFRRVAVAFLHGGDLGAGMGVERGEMGLAGPPSGSDHSATEDLVFGSVGCHVSGKVRVWIHRRDLVGLKRELKT